MSGTAALSAARKRRASNAQGPPTFTNNATPSSFSNTSNSYYNSMQQPSQSNGAAGYGNANNRVQSNAVGRGANMLIPQNMTIYENIDLIRAQMEDRLHIITTQSRTLPPEKLKILQKQQEIQTQILRQKILIAQEIEMENDANQAPHFPTAASAASKESPIIFEKGIPRPNPKYVPENQDNATTEVFYNSTQEPQQPARSLQLPVTSTSNNVSRLQQQNQPAANSKKHPTMSMPTAKLTPFVSMITTNGLIPPPVVILKSHDEKIGEHDAVLNDLTNRMNYINNRVDNIERVNIANEVQQKTAVNSNSTEDKRNLRNVNSNDKDIETIQETEEDEEEPTLLMDEVIGDLLNSREFMQGVVDKIMNETNLADVILKIDPIIKENQELRSLIHSQQQMLNQMNIMLLTFLNSQQGPVNTACTTVTINNDDNTVHNEDDTLDDDEHVTPDGDEHVTPDDDEHVTPDGDEHVTPDDVICDSNGLYDQFDNTVEEVEISSDLVLELNPADVSIIAEQHDELEVEEHTAPHFPQAAVDTSRITLLVQEIIHDEM